MPASHTHLYVHLVWATWDRLPLITAAIEPRLYVALAEKCRELKCVPLAVGGIADHMHMLVRLHPTIAVATLVKELKGSSSHLVTHELAVGAFFKWQGSYGAFTLREEEVPSILRYIRGQKEHHAAGNVWPKWEHTPVSDMPVGQSRD